MQTRSTALAISFLCISIASAPLRSQINSQNHLIRIGDLAKQLTEDEIAVLEITLSPGQMPWLLIGDPPQLSYKQYVEAFLPPTVSTPELRRGSVAWVTRQQIPFNPAAGFNLWTVDRTEDYAQISIPGRSFDLIDGDQDINRPFRVIGNLVMTI